MDTDIRNSILPLIEGEPKIGIVPVEPGLTNTPNETQGERIVGLNTENSEVHEGLIRFDIIFYVRMPPTSETKGRLLQIIINIEAQKEEPTGYHILNRATFYVSRLVSSQKQRDFVKTNYNDIKSVFSIWICMNLDENCMNHIHFTDDFILGSYHWKGRLDLLNIVMIGLTDKIPEHDEQYELHRLLGALLSKNLSATEKLNIIGEEYDIPIEDNLREEVNIMCNLGEGVRDAAIKENTKKFILNMHKKGYSLEQIAEVVEKGIEEVKRVIGNNAVC